MPNVELAIDHVVRGGDIDVEGEVYKEIFDKLSSIVDNLAFFLYRNSQHSHLGRGLADGSNISVPSMTLFLNYNEDFVRTGIDASIGGVVDAWIHAHSIRNIANVVLKRFGYDETFISDGTYVFLSTVERFAFGYIGRESKDAVREMIKEIAPSFRIVDFLWSSDGKYYISIRFYWYFWWRGVIDAMTQKIREGIPHVLAAADPCRRCKSYEVDVEVMSPFAVGWEHDRED